MRERTTRRRVLGALGGAGVLAACAPGAESGGGGEALTLSKTPVTVRALVRAGTDGHVRWFKQQTPAVFEKERPTVKVEFEEVTSGTIAEKLLVLASGDTVPDVVWLGVVADGGRGGITKGVLRPLDPVMKADKFNAGVYWKQALEMFSYQGQVYGIPRAGHFGCHVVYVNQALVRRAGVQVPLADGDWTTDQLTTWAKQLTRAGGGGVGLAAHGRHPGVRAALAAHLRRRPVQRGRPAPAAGHRPVAGRPAVDVRRALQGPGERQPARQPAHALPAGQAGVHAGHAGDRGGVQRAGSAVRELRVGGDGGAQAPYHRDAGHDVRRRRPLRSKQSTHVAESWEWVKWITNKDNGVLQVAGGAGSPGAREDVWGDPRLAQISPIYGLIQRTFKTPGPTHLPWNETYFDLTALVNARLNDFWDGKTGLTATVQAITAEAAPILQKPPA